MSENLLQQILSEMKGFKKELGHLRTDMETQGKDLRTEISGLRSGMNERFDRVDARFDQVGAELSVLKGGQQGIRNEITDRFRETNEHLSHLQRQMNLLDADYYLLLRKTAHMERDINRLILEGQ